ncbi:MAG: ABC transporter permease [Thermoflexales bacterium]|nr:ABC transporter permease [Thermoflexales bacterium]
MKAFWAIVRKELRSVSREKTIIIAISIQLVIASLSSVVLIGLLSFYDPEAISANIRGSVRVGVLGEVDNRLLNILRERRIRTTFFQDTAAAERTFQAGNLDALLYVPVDTGGVSDMKLVLPRAETRASVILIMLQESLKRYENVLRAERGLELRYTDVTGSPSTTYEFLYTVIVPVLMFFPAFVAGSMTVDSISEELENNTLDTLRSAPVSVSAIFSAKITAALILAVIQCCAWLVLLRFNQIAVQNVLAVLALALLVAALNSIGSALIATAMHDRERSQFVYSIAIVGFVGATSLLGVSPVNLLMRLATGAGNGWLEIAGYTLGVAVIAIVFGRTSRRLVTV